MNMIRTIIGRIRHVCLIGGICWAVSTNAAIVPSATMTSNDVDSLLNIYDHAIETADSYIEERRNYIDSLKSAMDMSLPKSQIAIGKLYIPYQCDSALFYLSQASHATEEIRAKESTLYLIYLLASIGYYNEGFILSNTLHPLPPELLSQYYETLAHLHGEAFVYGKMEQLKQFHQNQAAAYKDSLFYALQHKDLTPTYISRYGWKENEWLELKKMQLIHAREKQDYEQAISISNEVLGYVAPNTHAFAIFAYETACIYNDMQDSKAYLAWLLRSSIADVQSGVCDNASSWMIASIMYEDGQLGHAMKYIDYSQTNARFFNAKLRRMQITPLNNLISDTYQLQTEKMSKRMQWSVVGLIVLLATVIILLLFSTHQNRRLHQFNNKQKKLNSQLKQLNAQLLQLNQSLRESDHVKEQYICKYLEVYSEYIQRITKMARKAGLKDPEGFMKQEMQQFYVHFDNTFLTIYHNFVTEFNKLLKPSHQIYPKQGELLTTELRIFALIRLGIDSSAKIAKLLCYSPNTIYNYRASMRNASLGDRETFEERVKALNCNN
jgi:hypothetical protein